MGLSNPLDWPDYPDDPNDWAQYTMMPGRMPRHTAPEDVPLPFDRTNGNRNYKQLMGNSTESMQIVHKGIDFVKGAAPPIPHWPSTLEVKLGATDLNFHRTFMQLRKMVGDRPHPLYGILVSNTPKDMAYGETYVGMVFAAVWKRRWWPICEVTVFQQGVAIYHRLVPSRHLYADNRNRSFTEQLVQHQTREVIRWE